jgi:hypothetical protein
MKLMSENLEAAEMSKKGAGEARNNMRTFKRPSSNNFLGLNEGETASDLPKGKGS